MPPPDARLRRDLRRLAAVLTIREAFDRMFAGLAWGALLAGALAAAARAGAFPLPAAAALSPLVLGALAFAASALGRPVRVTEAAWFAEARVPGCSGLFGAALEADARPDWGGFAERVREAAARAWGAKRASVRVAFGPPRSALAAACLAGMAGALLFLPAAANGRPRAGAAAARALRGAAAGVASVDLRRALAAAADAMEEGTLSAAQRARLVEEIRAAGLADDQVAVLVWPLEDGAEDPAAAPRGTPDAEGIVPRPLAGAPGGAGPGDGAGRPAGVPGEGAVAPLPGAVRGTGPAAEVAAAPAPLRVFVADYFQRLGMARAESRDSGPGSDGTR